MRIVCVGAGPGERDGAVLEQLLRGPVLAARPVQREEEGLVARARVLERVLQRRSGGRVVRRELDLELTIKILTFELLVLADVTRHE